MTNDIGNLSGIKPIRKQDERQAFEGLVARIPGFSLSMLRDLPDCILLLTPTGRIGFVNRAGRLLLEVDDTSDLAGRDWWDLWPEDSRDLIRLAVARAANGEPISFEAVCPTMKGRALWWEVRVTPLVNAEGDVDSLLAVVADLGDRHGAPAPDDPED